MKNITFALQLLTAAIIVFGGGTLLVRDLIIPILNMMTGLQMVQSLLLLVIGLLVRIAWKAA